MISIGSSEFEHLHDRSKFIDPVCHSIPLHFRFHSVILFTVYMITGGILFAEQMKNGLIACAAQFNDDQATLAMHTVV